MLVPVKLSRNFDICRPMGPSFNSRAEDIEARGRKWKKAQRRWNHFVKSAIGGYLRSTTLSFFFCTIEGQKLYGDGEGALVTVKQQWRRYRAFSWVLVTCSSPPVRESRQICTFTLTRSCLFDIELENRIQGTDRRQVKALAKVLSFETDSEIRTHRRCRSLG